MPVSDEQVPAAFRLTCNAVCGCISNVEELRQIWEFYRQDGKGKFHCDGIAGTLLRLTYHLKRAKGSYSDVAWIIRTLYTEPPESVAGFSGATYHEIAINIAEAVVWQIAPTAKLGNELLDPLAGPDLSDKDLWKLLNGQRAQIVAKVSIDRVEGEYFWEEWSKALDSLPVLDTDNLIARIKIEAAHGAQKAFDLPVKNVSNLDRMFMERAVEEARKSKTEDNRVHPKVGVVIAKDGKELAVAHRGELDEGDHAEFTALEKKLADKVIAGATVYTTLEPCTTRSHSKLPCAVRLIARKVRRVVIGILDPNPKISGKGFHKLREANIDVDLFPPDLMSKIEEMNWEFIRHHKSMAESGPLESGANQEKATLKRRKSPERKATAAEFLRLMAGEWHLRFSKGGKQISEERCRIDATGGYYLLDRQPGQLWCKIEDVQYDAVTRNATFIKIKMRGKRWRHTETVIVLPDNQRMEGHDNCGQSLVYERLIAGPLTGPLTESGVFVCNQPLSRPNGILHMTRRYAAFDIETAKDVPGSDFNWRAYRPLGISCAAALQSDSQVPVVWHGKNADGSPAGRMSQDEARGVVRELTKWVADGYTLLTWNGLGFDFDVLGEESCYRDECKELAMNHVDMMFHVFCDRGFPVAIDKTALALGIPGKPPGMSGMLAPQLWAQGHCQDVLDYVAQDVRIALEVARVCEQRRRFKWITQKGVTRSMDLPQGWLTVRDAMRLPEPDTSWMDSAIPRRAFTNWLRT